MCECRVNIRRWKGRILAPDTKTKRQNKLWMMCWWWWIIENNEANLWNLLSTLKLPAIARYNHTFIALDKLPLRQYEHSKKIIKMPSTFVLNEKESKKNGTTHNPATHHKNIKTHLIASPSLRMLVCVCVCQSVYECVVCCVLLNLSSYSLFLFFFTFTIYW